VRASAGRRWRTGVPALLAVLAAASGWAQGIEKPQPAAAASYPSGRINGLVFGDYYSFPDHHDEKFDGQHGFWLRRAFFGYDYAFSERMNARLRFEMNGNGFFAGGNMTPFLKDAFFAWRYKGKQQVRLGIQPTISFESEDAFWGLRHIEKTPTDLYLIDAARDFGITMSGPIGGNGLSYAVQFGNESGQNSEADATKILRLFALFEARSGLRVEGTFNYGRRPSAQHRTTAKGLVGFKRSAFRGAAEFLWQERQSGTAAPDTTIAIWSGYGVWDFLPRKASVYARLDSVSPKRGDLEIGLPGAEGMPYLSLASSSPFLGFIGGLELTKGAIRIGPNVEYFDYEDDALGHDVAARLTFYWVF